MKNRSNRAVLVLAVIAVLGLLAPSAATARDPGVNQPGRTGGTAGAPGVGVGAPGAGTRDPGINQPGAAGNRGVAGVGVGAPGVGARDPGINQPGAAGNAASRGPAWVHQASASWIPDSTSPALRATLAASPAVPCGTDRRIHAPHCTATAIMSRGRDRHHARSLKPTCSLVARAMTAFAGVT